MSVLITRIIDEFKSEAGFTIGELIEILNKFPAEFDVRVEAINGEEMLEIVELNVSRTEEQEESTAYKYLLLKAQDVDIVHEIMAEEFECLSAIRKAFSDYLEKLKNRENGNTAGYIFIDEVGKILAESSVENE